MRNDSVSPAHLFSAPFSPSSPALSFRHLPTYQFLREAFCDTSLYVSLGGFAPSPHTPPPASSYTHLLCVSGPIGLNVYMISLLCISPVDKVTRLPSDLFRLQVLCGRAYVISMFSFLSTKPGAHSTPSSKECLDIY